MNTRTKAVQGRNQTREGLESPRFIRGEDVKEEVKIALDLIDRGLQSVNGTRDVHVSLQNAVQTVRMALLRAQAPITEAPVKPEAEEKENLPKAEVVE